MFIANFFFVSLSNFAGAVGVAGILLVTAYIGMTASFIGFFYLLFAPESSKKQQINTYLLELTFLSPVFYFLLMFLEEFLR